MIHAITATWAINKAKKREALSRRCPKCGGELIASEKKGNDPVFCEKCGMEIPPSKTAKREAEESGQNDE